jgi:hypothetical protein
VRCCVCAARSRLLRRVMLWVPRHVACTSNMHGRTRTRRGACRCGAGGAAGSCGSRLPAGAAFGQAQQQAGGSGG